MSGFPLAATKGILTKPRRSLIARIAEQLFSTSPRRRKTRLHRGPDNVIPGQAGGFYYVLIVVKVPILSAYVPFYVIAFFLY